MGRWTGAKYRLQENRNLYVLSAYRPCPSTTTTILPQSNSTFAQQFFKMKLHGIAAPNPREQFVLDIIKFIHDLKAGPMDMILLMFDANEHIGKEKNGIINIIEQAGLVDLFPLHHATTCNIATQVKGSQRIDYMLGSQNMLPYIQNCGFLPFHTQIVTDHRGMFMDLCTSLIDVTAIGKMNTIREIGSTSTMNKTLQYKEYIHQQFHHHNIQQRAEEIHTQSQLSIEQRPIQFMRNLNLLDKAITQIMLQSEQKYAEDPLKRWLTNETIQQLYSILKYWQIKISEVKNKKDFSGPLNNIRKNIKEKYYDHLLQYNESPKKGLSTIKQELTKEKKLKLQEIRDQEAAESAMIAQAENTSETNIQQKRAQVKYTRSVFANLKSRFKQKHGHGIQSVIVPRNDPQEENQYRTITEPKEVEETLIHRNIKHFGQAQGTPFTAHDITNDFGYTGVTEQATQLIQGRDVDSLLNKIGQGEKLILQQLNDGENSQTIDINISYKEFTNGFKKWRENTSTSPSGRHLGHYKALLRAEIKDNNEHIELNTTTHTKNPIGEHILKIIYLVAMSTLNAGETLERWKNVQSSMIEKEPGNPLLHRLRVIHIYEADYNLLLKILWARKLTWNAHLNGTLHEAQAGSRPGKMAIDLVVYKEQKYLYSRLTRTPLLTMDNDAKACYDRIICNLAMLISQYFGMPKNACSMQAKTLENMEFHLKTALGVSEDFYKHSITTPVHGSGQGSCASPTLWLLISTILMRCLDRGNPGMAMVQIQKNEKILRSNIDGFVDDTSLFSNIPFQYSNMTDAVRNLQGATQTWAKLLEASGGKLELSKCFYYVLSWKFTNEGCPIPMTIQEQEHLHYPKITINDPETNNEIYIQQKECQCHHKTLGVHKNILGDDSYQFAELLKKSNNMAQIAHGARMSKHHARVAFHMIYIPTIQYCLPACSFSLKQGEMIQAKALEKFLPAMGWRRTSSRALVHGPIELGGYNIPHMFALQGTQKLITMINHIRAKTEIGKLFIANINWIQVLSGRGTQFLHDNFKIEYIPENWTLHVQSYMRECNISLKSDKFWTPDLARKNDIFLMEAAIGINSGLKDLQIINYWRLYFRAFRLSDICDGYGKQILLPYRKFAASHQWTDTRQSNLNWPKQSQPNKTSFNIWCKFLKLAFQMQNTGYINIKLEEWIIPVTHKRYKMVVIFLPGRSYSLQDDYDILRDTQATVYIQTERYLQQDNS